MSPETILQIVRLSLELALEIVRGIPVEQRQQFWIDHNKRMQFWDDLFARLTKGEPAK